MHSRNVMSEADFCDKYPERAITARAGLAALYHWRRDLNHDHMLRNNVIYTMSDDKLEATFFTTGGRCTATVRCDNKGRLSYSEIVEVQKPHVIDFNYEDAEDALYPDPPDDEDPHI